MKAALKTDGNSKRIKKFTKVNHPIKRDLKLPWVLETEKGKLLEFNRQMAAIAQPDTKIYFNDASFIQYEQFRHNDIFH